MAAFSFETLALRNVVREAIDNQDPICACSAEVAERWLRDQLRARAAAADAKALPQYQRYAGNQARLAAEVDAAITQVGGWYGAVCWLHAVMMEKVRIHAEHPAPTRASAIGRQRCEHTAIQTGLILARLERVLEMNHVRPRGD